MTQTIKLPDGTTLQFPDGMSDQDMASAIAKNFPQFAPKPAAPEAQPQPNADGTYGKPPPGFVLNPATGQMTSPELMAQNMQPSQLDALAAGATQGYTFGGSDEINGVISAIKGMMGGAGSYDYGVTQARAAMEAAKRDHPAMAIGGELAGAVGSPINKIMGPLGLSGEVAKDASTSARVGNSALNGGALAAIYGALAGEGGLGERAKSALTSGVLGAGTGAAIPAIGAAYEGLATQRATRAAMREAGRGAPTADQLKAAAQAQYKAISDAGVEINPSVVSNTANSIVGDMVQGGLDTGSSALNLTPKAARLSEILNETVGTNQPVPFAALDQLRQKAGSVASDVQSFTGRPTLDAKLGMGAIEGLDKMVNSLTPADVTGDLQALQSALPKARELWTRMSKSRLIEDAISAGNDNYLSGAASGIRNQFKRILNNPKLVKGFSEIERAAMKRVVNGNIAEQAVTLLGGGMGNLATLGIGTAGGLPGLAAGAAVSAGTRKLSSMIANRNAEIARAIVANGGAGQLPVAGQNARAVIEALLRRATAASLPQQSLR